MQFRTAFLDDEPYSARMQSQQTNGAVAATWILGAGLIGLLGDVTSVRGAAMVLAFGLVPPILLMLRGSELVRVTSARVRRPNP